MTQAAAFHAQWDTGYIIGMWITIGAAAICWLVAIGAGIVAAFTKGDHGGWTATIAVLCALVIGIIGTVIAWPFSGQYHRYVPEQGVVQSVGSRFLASDTQGGGSTQKYVVTFRDGRSFGVLDTRAANVRKGDYLTVLCEREFQFNAPNPGWNCNWGQDKRPDGTVTP